MNNRLSNFIPKLSFVFTLSLVLISVFATIFPASLIRFSSYFSQSIVDPFELGSWGIPIIITNAIFFSFLALYYRNENLKIFSLIKKIKNFDLPKQVSYGILFTIIFLYIVFSYSEILEEEKWGDFQFNLVPLLKEFSIDKIEVRYLDNLLIYYSQVIFGNVRLIPFLGSISLLFLTFFFTKKISNNYFSGILSVVIILQSWIFLKYDTAATYTNFWILFYLLSLYLVITKWQFSPVIAFASLFTKALIGFFFPGTIYFILRNNFKKSTKYKLLISYGIVFVLIILGSSYILPETSNIIFENRFWQGFGIIGLELRFDGFLLLSMLPLTVLLYLKSKNNFVYADSLLILLALCFLVQPISANFGADVLPYRYMPFVVFSAIGIGYLFSKKSKLEE